MPRGRARRGQDAAGQGLRGRPGLPQLQRLLLQGLCRGPKVLQGLVVGHDGAGPHAAAGHGPAGQYDLAGLALDASGLGRRLGHPRWHPSAALRRPSGDFGAAALRSGR